MEQSGKRWFPVATHINMTPPQICGVGELPISSWRFDLIIKVIDCLKSPLGFQSVFEFRKSRKGIHVHTHLQQWSDSPASSDTTQVISAGSRKKMKDGVI